MHKWEKYGPIVYQMLDAGLHLNAAAARLCINNEQATCALKLYIKYNNLPDPRRKAIRLAQIRNKNEDAQYTIEEHGPKWHKMHVGRAKRATDIARLENCNVEAVRSILKGYRQMVFGGVE